MSDRHQHLLVVLDSQEYTQEDLKTLMQSISLLRGVAGVSLGEPVALEDHLAREAAKRELREEIGKILLPAWSKR